MIDQIDTQFIMKAMLSGCHSTPVSYFYAYVYASAILFLAFWSNFLACNTPVRQLTEALITILQGGVLSNQLSLTLFYHTNSYYEFHATTRYVLGIGPGVG